MTGDITNAEARAREVLAKALRDADPEYEWLALHVEIGSGGEQMHAAVAAMLAFAAPPQVEDTDEVGRVARIIDPAAFGDAEILRSLGSFDERPERQKVARRIATAILAALHRPDRYREGVEDAARAFEQAIEVGYPTPAAKGDKCEHGQYGWEACIACYDDALTGQIAAIRSLVSPSKTGGE